MMQQELGFGFPRRALIAGACLSAAALVGALSGCSSENSPPAVEQVQFEDASVASGGEVRVVISYRVAASDYSSKAFDSLVTLPAGASYVLGSSKAVFGSARAPNAMGACSDGRTYLSYSFRDGEFQDPFYSDEFIAPLQLDFIADYAANEGEVIAGASEESFGDPCGPLTGESAKLSVSSDIATPTPTPSAQP